MLVNKLTAGATTVELLWTARELLIAPPPPPATT